MIDIPVRRVTIPAPRSETPEGAAARALEEQRRTNAGIQSYVVDVCVALLESDLIRQRGELQSILQRTADDAAEQHELQQRISELELRRRALRVE